ncbi:YciI family protein [Georgenia alba]|uniref:YciI family protein n=1 Tax=Georgenia alba TaxID=2233858 RepID=A0ABW2QDU6_9MICO
MVKYLISFPSAAMVVPEADLDAVAEAAHAVIREAKAAGVYVFGGGIDEDVDAVLVSGDGTVSEETYRRTRELDGGFSVLDLPSREAALEWAARIAAACRCPQELRKFQDDPES